MDCVRAESTNAPPNIDVGRAAVGSTAPKRVVF